MYLKGDDIPRISVPVNELRQTNTPHTQDRMCLFKARLCSYPAFLQSFSCQISHIDCCWSALWSWAWLFAAVVSASCTCGLCASHSHGWWAPWGSNCAVLHSCLLYRVQWSLWLPSGITKPSSTFYLSDSGTKSLLF